MTRSPSAAGLRRTGLLALIVTVALAAAAGGYLITRALRTPDRTAGTTAAGPSPSAAVAAGAAPAGSTPARQPAGQEAASPTRAGVTRAVAGALRASGLGPQVRARVIDLADGAIVYDHDGSGTTSPASVAKILTATALLGVRAPTDRLRTDVVAGPGGAVVLVGGGDPTITAAGATSSATYPGAARLSDLAAQLTRAHVRPTRILVDDALFSGPAVSPSWSADDVPSSYGAAITAMTVDGGRATPRAPVRSAQPDLAAGRELAVLLHLPKLPVTRAGSAQVAAAAGARVLAGVESAPLSTMIEQMLHDSDNVIAETLARQVALAEHRPATFLGAAAAVRAVLSRFGDDTGGGFVDASGLARGDRVSPAALVATLRLAARTPRLRALLTELPVAGWSGTLAQRYQATTAHGAVGVVRAKTGTLTGVSSLAGVIHDRTGTLLGFAFIADKTLSTPDAEAALDAAVERLAACGCS